MIKLIFWVFVLKLFVKYFVVLYFVVFGCFWVISVLMLLLVNGIVDVVLMWLERWILK